MSCKRGSKTLLHLTEKFLGSWLSSLRPYSLHLGRPRRSCSPKVLLGPKVRVTRPSLDCVISPSATTKQCEAKSPHGARHAWPCRDL